ncbi:MAG: Zn-ribbon domain-containing OB-fold protein [Asgard group archaeon]|nr:Zn-ribbon domain-containing OB-fold protein [Asgard group archaeon]
MSVPRFWRRINSLYRLEGSKCPKCNKIYFPSRKRCVECNSYDLEIALLSGNGKVVTFSWVYTPPKGFRSSIPYCLAIIELEEGPRLTSQVVAVEEGQVSIDMPIEFAFRKISSEGEEGVITYGFKFRPRNYPNHK